MTSSEEYKAKTLSNAITSRIWWDLVYERGGDVVTNRDELDQAYRDRICKLPSNELEFILKISEQGIFSRTDSVQEAIIGELAERGLLMPREQV